MRAKKIRTYEIKVGDEIIVINHHDGKHYHGIVSYKKENNLLNSYMFIPGCDIKLEENNENSFWVSDYDDITYLIERKNESKRNKTQSG
jgi:hypothetical protein